MRSPISDSLYVAAFSAGIKYVINIIIIIIISLNIEVENKD